VTRHRSSCRHCPRVRLLGLDFRGWRHSWELTRESVTAGHASEVAGYGPGPTFRDYLMQMTGSGWPMSGRQP
jgi:hypothetical protein